MNLTQLIYLKELVHHGSFTRAAQHLGISQPALSTQIKNLEEETELVLIERNKKPVRLSKDGEVYYEMASEILQRIEVLKDLPFHLSNEVKGALRLGIIPTLAPYFISLIIEELELRYPELELIVEELITETIIQRIKTGHLDAGLVSTPLEISNMHQTPLFYEQFFLYVSDKHPLYERDEIHIEDLDNMNIWYLKEGNCFTNQVNAICNLAGIRKGRQNLVYFSHSIESLRRIVESRQGLTFIPELATMLVPSEMEDMIKPITGRQPVREISIVSGLYFSKKRLLDAFTEVALSQLPWHMKKKPDNWVVDTELYLER